MDLQKDSERGRKRTLTHFTRALKDAGLLLPMAVRENQEVTVSSRNICEYTEIRNQLLFRPLSC